MSRRFLQDRDHTVDHLIQCRSGWKIYRLLGIFCPVIRLSPMADNLVFAVPFFDNPG